MSTSSRLLIIGVCFGLVACEAPEELRSGPVSESQSACVSDADCEVGVCDVEQEICLQCLSDDDCAAGVCHHDRRCRRQRLRAMRQRRHLRSWCVSPDERLLCAVLRRRSVRWWVLPS